METLKKILFLVIFITAIISALFGIWSLWNSASINAAIQQSGGEHLNVETIISFAARDIGVLIFACFLGIVLLLFQRKTG